MTRSRLLALPLFVAVAFFLSPLVLAQDATDNAPPPDGTTIAIDEPSPPDPVVVASVVHYDNGPLVNSSGTGSGGADESILQSVTLGMNTLGLGHQLFNDNAVADDFTVPSGGWDIDQMVFYAYQTGSTTASTMTGVYVQVWDGVPAAPGSSVVWGDRTTNRLSSSTWSGIYRVTETSGGAVNRPIMANVANVDVTLPGGTYWVEWFTDGTLGSGPWAPPVTITGVTTTGNGLQSVDAGVTFGPAEDSGTLTQQGFPFMIMGPAGSPEVTFISDTKTPARGSFYRTRFTVANGTASPILGGVFVDIDVPGGTTVSHRIQNKVFYPGQGKEYRTKEPIPLNSPAGIYNVRVSFESVDRTVVYDVESSSFTLGPIPPLTATVQGGEASLVLAAPEAGPNPFSSATTIRYGLDAEAEVDLRVYDATGREVAQLASGVQSPGAHSAVFNGSDLPTGVYVWRLAIDGAVTTGRVSLVR